MIRTILFARALFLCFKITAKREGKRISQFIDSVIKKVKNISLFAITMITLT